MFNLQCSVFEVRCSIFEVRIKGGGEAARDEVELTVPRRGN